MKRMAFLSLCVPPWSVRAAALCFTLLDYLNNSARLEFSLRRRSIERAIDGPYSMNAPFGKCRIKFGIAL